MITPEMEALYGRLWRKLARSEGHVKRMPVNPAEGTNRTKGGESAIDNAFGDGWSIARMSHSGMSASEIAKAHGMSKTSFQSWLAKHRTTQAKLRAKYPAWMEAAE